MEVITTNNMNPSNILLETNEKIEKVLSIKCKTHPQRNADLLLLKTNVKSARICISCVQSDNIPTNNYLQIREVL